MVAGRKKINGWIDGWMERNLEQSAVKRVITREERK